MMTEWSSLLSEDIIKSDDVGRIRSKGCWVSKKVPEEHVGLKAKDMLYEVRRKVIESEDGEASMTYVIEELKDILQAYFVFDGDCCVDYHQPQEAGDYLRRLLLTLTGKNKSVKNNDDNQECRGCKRAVDDKYVSNGSHCFSCKRSAEAEDNYLK